MIRYLSSKVNIHLLGVSISFCVMKEKVIDQAGYFGFLNTYPDLFYLADLEMLPFWGRWSEVFPDWDE